LTEVSGYPYAGVVQVRKTSRPGLGICVLAVIVSGALSSVLLAIVAIPVMAGTAVSTGLSGGENFNASNIIALFVVLAVGRTLLQAWIAKWIVELTGAVVSFGRAIASLLVGNLVGLFAGVVGVIFFDQLGAGGFWLLSLTGFAASVVVLFQGGEKVEGQAGQAYVYKVPPNAPPGWPGTDL
jgi:hypothetical protein